MSDAAAKPTAVRKAGASSAVTTPAPAEAPREGTVKGAVTVTGCLQREGDGFRLKDTDGPEAPKSRSWKSGFLKRGSAALQIRDGANSARLADHVGQRVSVTGTLVEREMNVFSLRRVASTCE
jgi:hypothetical protein